MMDEYSWESVPQRNSFGEEGELKFLLTNWIGSELGWVDHLKYQDIEEAARDKKLALPVWISVGSVTFNYWQMHLRNV